MAMREHHTTESSHGYDWSRFGRHRLRAPAGVLIDSPLGPAGAGWLGTLWPAGDAPGWTRMLWTPATDLGGWTIPRRLASGDVIEFGTDHVGQVVRWYGILDSYDAVEWLILRGPFRDPSAAHQHAQELLASLRFVPTARAHRSSRDCTRRPTRHP